MHGLINQHHQSFIASIEAGKYETEAMSFAFEPEERQNGLDKGVGLQAGPYELIVGHLPAWLHVCPFLFFFYFLSFFASPIGLACEKLREVLEEGM